jgi:hypothetical protein
MSDQVKSRLDRRREELARRVALIEAAGELEEPRGEIAFAAVMDEMRHLLELYEACTSGIDRAREAGVNYSAIETPA